AWCHACGAGARGAVHRFSPGTWVLFQNSLPKRNHSKRDGEIATENLETRPVTCRRSVGAAPALRRFTWGAVNTPPNKLRYYPKTLRPNEIIQVVMGKLIIKIRDPDWARYGACSVPRRCSWGAGPSSPDELRYYAKTPRPNEIGQVVMGK